MKITRASHSTGRSATINEDEYHYVVKLHDYGMTVYTELVVRDSKSAISDAVDIAEAWVDKGIKGNHNA